MFKEIYEQFQVLINILFGCLCDEQGVVDFDISFDFMLFKCIFIVVCGIVYYVGLVGEYLIEQFVCILVEVDVVSEYCYCNLLVGENILVIVVSQLGEIIDMFEVMCEVKKGGV